MGTVLIEPNGYFKSSNGWQNILEIETLEIEESTWNYVKKYSGYSFPAKIIKFKGNRGSINNSHNYSSAVISSTIHIFKRAFKVKNEVKEIDNFFNF